MVEKLKNKTVTKEMLVEYINLNSAMSMVQIKQFVDAFFSEISEILGSGHELKLPGFGNFKLMDKLARPGRNPKSGEPCMIEPRRVVTFKAGKKMRAIVQSKMSGIDEELNGE